MAGSPEAAARRIFAGLVAPLESAPVQGPLPSWLLPHQADAVRRARAILARFGGVLVADGVGLGKTFVGLALAALERSAGGEALAIVPAALRDEWRRAAERLGMGLRLVSHTALARTPVSERVRLLLVDEAHAFRNPRTRRYDALARLAVGRRVVLLTATPLNNSTADLFALLHLFAAPDRFRELGVSDLEAGLEAGSAPAALALGAVTVCRTRRLVEERFPALRAAFPRRVLAPPVRYDLDAVYGGRLRDILEALEELAAGGGAERAAALMHLGLLRRLESSRPAFHRTLRRHRDYLDEVARAAESGVAIARRDFQASYPRGDADEAQLVMWPLLKAAQTVPVETARSWRRGLDAAWTILERLDPADDAKADALDALLGGDLRGVKTIVFTEYRDTALHLLRRLRLRHRVLAVAGSDAWAGLEPLGREDAFDAFAPAGRGARALPLLDADVLVATDVAGAGLNLQDAAAVVNYDLPWNPVRVMQRVGRIDRLHSPHARIVVGHLEPAGGARHLTTVLRRLRAKLGEGALAAGAEPDPLAALWWVEHGTASPAALERESWRRVAPFEARERWRHRAGRGAAGGPPMVAAGVTADDGPPAAGVLLAVRWRDGASVPLPFVVTGGGPPRYDPEGLAALAERASTARPIPVEPAQFASTLASVLPDARHRLLELSAPRHGGGAVSGVRQAVLARLERGARDLHHRRGDTGAAAAAIATLSRGLTAGLDRLVARLADAEPDAERLAGRLLAEVAPRLPPAAEIPPGPPRLELLAAIALATDCPSDRAPSPARPRIFGG